MQAAQEGNNSAAIALPAFVPLFVVAKGLDQATRQQSRFFRATFGF